MKFKERPRCRQIIEQWVADGRFTLQQIASGGVPGDRVGESLRRQAKRMLDEKTETSP